MVVDFEEYALEDLGKIITGKTPSTKIPEYFGHGFPFFTPRDMDGKRFITTTERYLTQKGVDSVKSSFLPPESILVSCIGSDMGKVTINKMAGVSNQQINSIILDQEKFNLLYVYYNLSARQKELKNLGASGSALPILNKGDFSKVQIFLPPLATQERIADILGTLDDKIELNRQMNHTLEAMARAIFKSWFVDFDPVYAKMEGRDYPLPAEVLDLFPAELVESELGLIPKGWEVGKLKDIIDFNPHYRLSKGTEATYLEMKVLPEKGFFPTDWRKREFTSGTKFTNGDTLLARITPCLENGKTAYINFLEPNEIAWGSTEYIVMRTKKDLPNTYSYLLARNGSFRKSAIKSMTGSSGRQRVQRKTLEELPTVIAPNKIYGKFDKIIKSMFEKMTANNLENITLAEIRDTLLPKLMSGKIIL